MICYTFEAEEKPLIPVTEILRYAGMQNCNDKEFYQKAQEIGNRCREVMTARLVYQRCLIQDIDADSVCFDNGIILKGTLPAKYLKDCKAAILVLATVGQSVDRLIASCSVCSLAQGLLADAAGSAAVEATLDVFCESIAKQESLKPRISPGYGDFPLSNQVVLIECLQGAKNLGVYLNDSMLMTPCKSVSALIGIRKDNHV